MPLNNTGALVYCVHTSYVMYTRSTHSIDSLIHRNNVRKTTKSIKYYYERRTNRLNTTTMAQGPFMLIVAMGHIHYIHYSLLFMVLYVIFVYHL